MNSKSIWYNKTRYKKSPVFCQSWSSGHGNAVEQRVERRTSDRKVAGRRFDSRLGTAGASVTP